MNVRVLRPGMLTTVQDSGRPGLRRHGVVSGGAMDDLALRCANILADNPADAAALECTIAGPELQFEDERVVVVTGFEPHAEINGRRVAPWSPAAVRSGDVLAVPETGRGCRAYVAISGGIAVEPVLRSRSTDLNAGFGGLAGRALVANDVLPVGEPSPRRQARPVHAGRSLLPSYSAHAVLRILPAPESGLLEDAGMAALQRDVYRVSADSNRMGCRLEGPRLALATDGLMVSSPVAAGTVQLPPSGRPIILTADAQTIGGYPRIAHVASVDLPVVAQLRPGHSVRFVLIDRAHAQRLAADRERDLLMLADGLRLWRQA